MFTYNMFFLHIGQIWIAAVVPLYKKYILEVKQIFLKKGG